MSITINEFRVLRTLADGEQHDKAPKGLTDAQFCIAVQLLEQKKLIYAAFEEEERSFLPRLIWPDVLFWMI